MTGLSVYSVTVACCNGNCDSLQRVVLVRGIGGKYSVPDEIQCSVCGCRLRIVGDLRVFEVRAK